MKTHSMEPFPITRDNRLIQFSLNEKDINNYKCSLNFLATPCIMKKLNILIKSYESTMKCI